MYPFAYPWDKPAYTVATLVPVSWEPTEQEIEEKLIELAYTLGDIEEEIEKAASGDDGEANFLSAMLSEAVRVEAVFGENDWADPCTFYVLLFDVAAQEGRESARLLQESGSKLSGLIRDLGHPWLIAQQVSGLVEKFEALERRVGEVERVNARLEAAALTTARALEEIAGHWDAVYEAMRRPESS